MLENTPSGLIMPNPILQLPMQALIKVPAAAVNALHPSFSDEDRQQLLTMQYRSVTYQDAMVSGNAYLDANGVLLMNTTRPEASFKGLVFEAYLARMCRDYPATIGRKVFAWCTERQSGRVSDSLLNQYTAFVTADKSLMNQVSTAWLYNTASPFDVQFYRINENGDAELATLVKSGTTAGIQVKAITGNERSEIIDLMLQNRYRHVLTLLRHSSGEHSHDVCMRILAALQRSGEITGDDYRSVVTRLAHPDQLGLDQYDVDQYSYYLSMLHRSGGNMDQNVVEAITLEVTDNLIQSQGGILLPAQQSLALQSQQLH